MTNHKISEELKRKLDRKTFDEILSLEQKLNFFREHIVESERHIGVDMSPILLQYKKNFQRDYNVDYSHEFSSLYVFYKNRNK